MNLILQSSRNEVSLTHMPLPTPKLPAWTILLSYRCHESHDLTQDLDTVLNFCNYVVNQQ